MRRSRTSEALAGLALVAAPLALLGFLLLYPATRSVLETLQPVGPDGTRGWSLALYRRFFEDGHSTANYLRTVWTTAVTLGILLVTCLPVAVYLHLSRSRLASVVQALALFPMFVPGIIVAYALIRYVGPNGVAQMLLERVGVEGFTSPYLTKWGPVIGLVWDHLPLTLLILTAGMAKVSADAIDAARDVGAGWGTVFVAIILPQIADNIAVVISLSVISLFGSFILPYMLGPAAPEMMGPYMLRTFAEVRQPDFAAAQAVITFLSCAVFGVAYVMLLARRQA